MRERGMGGSRVIGMGTWDVSDGSDSDLVVCWDEGVGGLGGGDDNDWIGCDGGAGDGVGDVDPV